MLPVWVLLRNKDGDIYIQSLIKQRPQIINSQNNGVKMRGKIEFSLHVLEYTWKDLIEAWRSLFKRGNMQHYVSHYIYEELLLGPCYDISTGYKKASLTLAKQSRRWYETDNLTIILWCQLKFNIVFGHR